jgi:hypothetical protein
MQNRDATLHAAPAVAAPSIGAVTFGVLLKRFREAVGLTQKSWPRAPG